MTTCHNCVPIFLRFVLCVATGHAVHRMAFSCCSVSEVLEVLHQSTVSTALSTLLPPGPALLGSLASCISPCLFWHSRALVIFAFDLPDDAQRVFREGAPAGGAGSPGQNILRVGTPR